MKLRLKLFVCGLFAVLLSVITLDVKSYAIPWYSDQYFYTVYTVDTLTNETQLVAQEAETYTVNIPASKEDYSFKGYYMSNDYVSDSLYMTGEGTINGGNVEKYRQLIREDVISHFYNPTQTYYYHSNFYYNVYLYSRWEFHATPTIDGVKYLIDDSKSATVINNNYSGKVVIPDEITYKGVTYPVVAIGADAFKYCNVQALEIPSSITKVEPSAFANANVSDIYTYSLTSDLGTKYPQNANLHAYSTSVAYKNYEANGYKGKKIPYTCNITYVLDGGTTTNPDRYNLKEVTLLTDAKKEGYRFDGWFTKNTFEDSCRIYSIGESCNEDITLYAKYTQSSTIEKTVVITTKKNEEKETTQPTQSKETVSKETVTEKEEEKSVSLSKTSFKTVKNKKGKTLYVSFGVANGAEGYEIQCSSAKKFNKNVKKVQVETNSYTFKKLKKGKSYYVRVRAFAKNNKNEVVYGKWSKVKKIEIKK